MRAMLRIGFGLAAAFLPALAFAADDTLGEKIVGTYTYVSGQRGAAEVDKGRLIGKVEITKTEFKLLGEDGSESFVMRYELDAQGDGPGKLKMEITKAEFADAVGSKARGLIKIEGDTVTLIYDYGGGDDVPDDFEPDDDVQHKFVLKRAEPKR